MHRTLMTLDPFADPNVGNGLNLYNPVALAILNTGRKQTMYTMKCNFNHHLPENFTFRSTVGDFLMTCKVPSIPSLHLLYRVEENQSQDWYSNQKHWPTPMSLLSLKGFKKNTWYRCGTGWRNIWPENRKPFKSFQKLPASYFSQPGIQRNQPGNLLQAIQNWQDLVHQPFILRKTELYINEPLPVFL